MSAYLCLTCSDKELLYFFDMRFLIVSLTDLTFLPSEIREVVGDLTTSLYTASCSLFCETARAVSDQQRGWRNGERERWMNRGEIEESKTKGREITKTRGGHGGERVIERDSRDSTQAPHSLFEFHELPALTLASEPALTTWSERLDRSKPPKLHVLCGGEGGMSHTHNVTLHI